MTFAALLRALNGMKALDQVEAVEFYFNGRWSRKAVSLEEIPRHYYYEEVEDFCLDAGNTLNIFIKKEINT